MTPEALATWVQRACHLEVELPEDRFHPMELLMWNIVHRAKGLESTEPQGGKLIA